MRLPDANRALVAQEKITELLLASANEGGKPEAGYFSLASIRLPVG